MDLYNNLNTHQPNFSFAWNKLVRDLKEQSSKVHTEKWQGVAIRTKPEMAMHELINYNIFVDLRQGGTDLNFYQKDIQPNLPWADDHFLERVCGKPINPGEQWKHWPWGNHADKFRDKEGKFNHNYMERYWPKYANQEGTPIEEWSKDLRGNLDLFGAAKNKGLRYGLGDLKDVISLLSREPLTRQAYMPIFFPEDTGAIHGGRIPCSLGYHFYMREGKLNVNYYMRSCDVYRHLRDDMYLTVRLLIYILGELKYLSPEWDDIKLGTFSMYTTSMHCFVNDIRLL